MRTEMLLLALAASFSSAAAIPYNATVPSIATDQQYHSSELLLMDGAILGEEQTCGAWLQQRYNCSDDACEDLVPGYINYLNFFFCDAHNVGLQILTFILFMVWMAYLLHLVETTTNNYFCASLTMAVDILKLSPNVAGVTFLAVGNAACDVIASIAAFSTGVPKVGVGTTLGAGIFVTTAVIGVVSFVSDVRLARRSFVRDILFFILTVVYLLVVSSDGFIDLGESIGFMIIYIVFVAVVGSARFFKMLHSADEDANGTSFAGSTGEEGPARRVSLEIVDAASGAGAGNGHGGYNSLEVERAANKPRLGLIADNRDRSISMAPDRHLSTASEASDEVGGDDIHVDVRKDMLAALDAARTIAMKRQEAKDLTSLKNKKYFAREVEEQEDEDVDDDDDDGDGDLGGGSGDVSTRLQQPGEEDGGMKARTTSFTEDIKKISKPSRWTRQFLKTQQEAGPAYAPFQWTKYHKKHLAKELATRLKARGASTITTTEGNTVDFIELLATDPDAAAELAASIGTAVTVAASRRGRPLTFEDARIAASHGARAHAPGGKGVPATATTSVTLPVVDVLAVLPHETIKPVARMYTRLKAVVMAVQPYYHGFMHVMELPIQGLRKLTVPALHEGSYRRRLLCIVMPGMCAFFTLILTTHVFKGKGTLVGGFPSAVIAAIVGVAIGVALHFTLPRKAADREDGSSQSLLAASKAAAKPLSVSALAAEAHAKHRPWYKKLGLLLAGPNDHPLPQKPVQYIMLVLSFVMALFWLLVVANEIVGTAIFIGKVLNIPDVVMGLTVLAVGNSINDLAASLTIARDGYASMAVAGAYAGPMFNILAGIGLPMLMATANSESHKYDIGTMTPLVICSYAALLIPLCVTLLWVPFEGWRITHRIGRFLCAWFFAFILLVIIVGFGGLSKGDTVEVGG